jgi:uncharacterized lipoprotein YehR (DUF1307 family)
MKTLKKNTLWVFLVLFSISFITCNNDSNIANNGAKYPSLKVVNHLGYPIRSVSLVGYQFNNLNIVDNQTFALTQGMPGGYNNINITITYGDQFVRWSMSNTFNFKDGQTTTITAKGSGAEGSPDYNNYRLE